MVGAAGSTPETLGGKLLPPKLGRHNIQRVALLERLSVADDARIFLVRAPAGSGKSTLLHQVAHGLAQDGYATGWLTLDSSDNDVIRLMAGVHALLQAIDGGREIRGDLIWSDFQQAMTRVITRMGRITRPFAVFLDDVERLTEPEPARLLRDLIAHLPQNGRVYLGSRNIPNLNLGRLRANGKLVELGWPDLMFTCTETEDYVLRRRGVALSVDELARLYRMTEGWPAGLTLAATAIERQADPGNLLTPRLGRDQTMAEYFAEEVFARCSPQIQSFLLRTSILRELDPALCSAVADCANAGAILETLSVSSVLMGALDAARNTYRYHGLFSEFMRARLEQNYPAGEIAQMHLAAAAQYLREKRPVPAIDHLIEARAYETARGILACEIDRLLGQGRMRLLLRWFEKLPEDKAQEGPELRIARIWALGLGRNPAKAFKLLEGSELAASDALDISAHVRAMQATFLAMMGRLDEAYEVGKAAVPFLPSPAPFADTLLLNTMSTVTGLMGHRQEARRHNENAKRSLAPGADMFNLMYSEAGRGILDLQEGHLREALARLRTAVTEAHPERRNLSGGNAYSAIPYAAALYESGLLDESEALVQAYLPMARDLSLTDHLVLGYRITVRIAQARDDHDGLWEALVQMERAGVTRGDERLVGAARLEWLRVLLQHGDVDEARAAFLKMEADPLWDHVARMRYLAHETEDLEIARLRLLRFDHNLRAVPGSVEAMRRSAARDRRLHRWLKLSLLQARLYEAVGDPRSAAARLEEAAAFARTQGYVRIYFEEGVSSTAQTVAADRNTLVCLLPAVPAKRPLTPASVAGQRTAPVQEGALTGKEVEVLRLLSKGFPNLSICEELEITDSTVRTHLRSINRKLQAQSRTHAVAIAQEIGLI
ncbi:LuxR C-terminal-related transcriptional regulator [Xanthobacter versatilis]|uniref:LuxR C-terminal-related transcriptional regulator n=1 Tax=Xanthobacter autotrophicus (strain ATCC BAA-1158 / Py2) TaxID=78245 RepID=UPI00372B1461